MRKFLRQLQKNVKHSFWINSKSSFKNESEIRKMVQPDVTDDSVFGYLTHLNMTDYFDQEKLRISKRTN